MGPAIWLGDHQVVTVCHNLGPTRLGFFLHSVTGHLKDNLSLNPLWHRNTPLPASSHPLWVRPHF